MTDLPPSVLPDSPADKPSIMEMGGENASSTGPSAENWMRITLMGSFGLLIVENCRLLFSRYRLEFKIKMWRKKNPHTDSAAAVNVSGCLFKARDAGREI